jgi:hypothetical protein
MFRYALYPLIGILYASYNTYLLISPINNDIAALAAGLVAAGMLGFVYIAIPMQLIRRFLRRKASVSMVRLYRLAACSVISGLLVGMGYLFGGESALGITTVSLILSTLSLGAALGNFALSHLHFAYEISGIMRPSRHLKPLAWRSIVRLQLRGQKFALDA